MNGAGSMYGLDDHIYQRLLRERIVFLGSEVRDQNANAICAQLLLLSAEDPEADIFLHINSPGGSVDAGMAIYDTMNYIPNDVATVGMGLAASMGQFLLCAGTKGKRYALPHARIMMHQPSSGMGGSASDIKIQAQQSLHIKKVLLDLIAEHTGQPRRAGHRRRRPRPLVHRRPGDRVRPGRPGRHQRPRGRRRGPPRAAEGLTPMNYYIPQWEERTSYGFRRIDPYAKLFEDRIIYLGTPISDDVANAVIAQLLCLESMNPDQDISIYINSPGGSFTALTAIYDTMKFIKPDVQTVCLGQAASAAAILLAAGTPGKRLALPNSRILIHQPYTEGTFGQTSDIEIQANEILRMRELLEKMISDHSGKRPRAGQPRHRARQDPHRRGRRRVRPDRPGDRVPQGHPRAHQLSTAVMDVASCPAPERGRHGVPSRSLNSPGPDPAGPEDTTRGTYR